MGEPGEAVDPRRITEVDELSSRVDRLATRVEVVAGLVETLLDRVPTQSVHQPLTAEELADVAARMMRLIESRLTSHHDRLAEVVTEVVSQVPSDEIDLTDDGTQLAQLSLIDDHLALVGRAVLDVKQAVASIDTSTNGSQEAVIVQQISDRLEETSTRVLEHVDAQLAQRVQRFEALSQSMMNLVGEPVDALTDRLHQLARQREPSAELAEQIRALRQDALEREAVLRHLVARFEELAESLVGVKLT